ncbi:CBS domain-containing protein [Varunaivibrio sulfuroxidans]|uniref:CBS domain-containing protein n=1 Tax=Varunaivibrio sulfuroxidans TaxID=1773489 RepID=A0A4R3J677_9PROT|nr:CBS domain-containing protein [Varunaivibrio sulfuroxidans]TCS60842.1 CBS domain-containing protein [Varunaivibrio sulfuroxidans]WES31743.1 CBS domain-containing protein [Varunaivibrio sulfuroxidans]
MLIRSFMTPDPVTVQPDTPVEDIASLLLAHRINGVPVVNGAGRLIGVVTAEDLIHRGADERLAPRESIWKESFWVSFLGPMEAHRDKAEGHTAAEVMTAEVHSVAPDMHPSIAARLMVDHHLTSLPVVEDGKVIGVISRIDLLSLLKELENPLKREN